MLQSVLTNNGGLVAPMPVVARLKRRASPAQDKAKRYAWSMKHRPGALLMVDKNIILVDSRYQRLLNDGKRLQIAADFNWVAFGVLSVNKRSDGSIWCIDGQHRLAAAKSREDVLTVPVSVFSIPDSVEEEALAFLALNTLRRPLTSKEKFRASLISGDLIASVAQELIQGAGRSIDSRSSESSVDCLTALMNVIRLDEQTARKVWPVVTEICEGHNIDNRLLQGFAYLERKLQDKQGERRSITEPDNKRKLVAAGRDHLMREVTKAAAYYHRGGERVFAEGLLNVINYRRQHRLFLKGQDISAD